MGKWFMVFVLLFAQLIMAKVIIVDPNGQIKTIQAGINVAAAGDTVKVLPGTYDEQVVLNKDIVLMGSGYENTIITGNYNPTVEIKSGYMQWFTITSLAGDGVKLGGGTIRNCVIKACAMRGIYCNSGTAYVKNCVVLNNAFQGIYVDNTGYLYVINSISWKNNYAGFERKWEHHGATLNLSYSIGHGVNTINNQGVINEDPQFTSEDDYHIGSDSPGWDAGQPSLTDPDGSRSDIGYFGGPHAPIYPVVTKIELIPLENGGVQIKATGRANW